MCRMLGAGTLGYNTITNFAGKDFASVVVRLQINPEFPHDTSMPEVSLRYYYKLMIVTPGNSLNVLSYK